MSNPFASSGHASWGLRHKFAALIVIHLPLSLPPLAAAKEGDVAAAAPAAMAFENLAPVQQRMQRAESLLADRDASGRASTTQQEVVSELDAMIAKLQKQCESCGGQCN